MAKGGSYEREVCRKLSLWASHGKFDDWYWRASQSGGRATTRAKSGKRTIGHAGDIAACCREATTLTDLITFEIKRGYNRDPNNTLYHLLDLWRNTPAKIIRVVDFIKQARAARDRAGSKYWAVIHRLDYRESVIFAPEPMFWELDCVGGTKLTYKQEGKQAIVAMQFDDFMECATPPKRRKK